MRLPITRFEGLFQIAYVTRDLDAAVAAARDRFGISEMLVIRDMVLSRATRLSLALAWIGPWMIELIEPHGDGTSVYEAIAPDPGTVLRMHHLGHEIADEAGWERLRAQIDASGDPIAAERDKKGIRFLFVDSRPTLGCFTEHMIFTPEGRRMFDAIPRN